MEESSDEVRRSVFLWLNRMGLCALWSVSALAQNRGVYPLGMSAVNSGVTPQSGFTYSNQLLFYSRDTVKDDAGRVLPISGLNTVLMDMNSLVWVSKERVLGARYSATATLPFARNNLTSDIHGPLSGGGGFADSYYMPLILGWDSDRVNVRAIYGFLAPTGRFVNGATSNVGSGYWTHALSSGQTYFLLTNKRLTLSMFEMYEFHTTQAGSQIHPGQTFDLDYSVMATVVRKPAMELQSGFTGYGARQTTAKTGPSITVEESNERYGVNAAGVAFFAAFPRAKANLGFRFYQEFANRSTFEGHSVQISGAISF